MQPRSLTLHLLRDARCKSNRRCT